MVDAVNHDFPEYLTFDDVLLLPNYTDIQQDKIDLSTSLNAHLNLDIPIIAAPMDTVCEDKMAKKLSELGGLGIIHRNQSINQQVQQIQNVFDSKQQVGAAIGLGEDHILRLQALISVGVRTICIDAAHGDSAPVVNLVKFIKNSYPGINIIAGNVATYTGAKNLYGAGADILRVGKGAGSICITRVTTGVGVPQFTAILETARAAREFNRTIIADGGIRNGGDIVKALAAGASAVMLGSLLASTDESPGLISKVGTDSVKQYRGMGSITSMKAGSADRYRQSPSHSLTPEGVEGKVLYRGNLESILYTLLASVKSGLYTIGASNLPQLTKKAKFIRTTISGKIESYPHDLYARM